MADTKKTVIYKGPSSRADISTEYHIADENGKMHVLVENQETEVPEALAKELLDGSDRTKGHKFAEPAKAEASAGNRQPSTTGS